MTYTMYTQRDKMFVNINLGQQGWRMVEIPNVNRTATLQRLEEYLKYSKDTNCLYDFIKKF